jgi:hypothetical protein
MARECLPRITPDVTFNPVFAFSCLPLGNTDSPHIDAPLPPRYVRASTPGTAGGSFDLTTGTGTFAMQTTWLDGYAQPHTDTLAQTVTIPGTCKSATFSFWVDIQTNDPSGAAYDTLKVQVLNSSGTVLSTLATYSNLNKTSGYVQHSFSPSSYIGQKITLKFTGKETLYGYNTSFLEDSNALNVS